MQNIALYTKEIHYCSECPNCYSAKQYYADSWEDEEFLMCQLSTKPIGTFELREQGRLDIIPDWCKLLKK